MYWCNLIRLGKSRHSWRNLVSVSWFPKRRFWRQRAILKIEQTFCLLLKEPKKRNAYLEHKQRNTMSDDFFRCLTALHTNETKWSEKIIESTWKIFDPCRKGQITATHLHPSPPISTLPRGVWLWTPEDANARPLSPGRSTPIPETIHFWGMTCYEIWVGPWNGDVFNMNRRWDYKGSRIPFQFWFSFGHWNSNATDSIHTGSQHLIVIIRFGNSVQCSWPQPVVQPWCFNQFHHGRPSRTQRWKHSWPPKAYTTMD